MSNTILLADDSLTIQKVVELTFADTEYEVVTTSSGDELLEKLPSVQPDVIICDVIMPGTDGYSVCQAIKSDASTLHIPVILLTGTFEPFDKERALAAGCDEIITKPFEARNLVATVEKLVSGESGTTSPPAPPSEFEGTVRNVPAEPHAGQAVEPSTQPAFEEEPVTTAPAAVAEEPPAAAVAPPFDEVAPEVPEDGMDFTTTGFAEMEAAGQRPRTDYEQVPDEGLEFKIEDVESPGEIDATIPERGAEPDVFTSEPPVMPTAGPGEAGIEDMFEAPGDDHPFEEPAPAAEPPSTGHRAVTAPIPVPARPETPPVADSTPPPAPGLDSEAADLFSTEPGDEPLDDASTQLFTQSPLTQPPAPEATATSESVQPEPVEEMPAQPEPAPEPAPEPVVPPSEPAATTALSDGDIERIARRVVELASDTIERIAWDVIPDMAELVVRQRIREIEEEAEHAGDA